MIDSSCELEKAHSQCKNKKRKPTTIGDLVDSWEELVMPLYSAKQQKSHFLPCLRLIRNARALGYGTRQLKSLTRADGEAFRDELLTGGRAPSYARKVMNVSARIVRWGREELGILSAGYPFVDVALPPQPAHRDRRLSPDEERRLFQAAAQKKQHAHITALLRLGLDSGAHLGELLALDWQDVDFAQKTVALGRERANDTQTSKSGHVFRTIPLSPAGLEALRSLPRSVSGGRVFTVWKAPDSFTKQMKHITAAAKISNFSFHDLRNEFGYRVARRVSMQEIMYLFGTRSAATVGRFFEPNGE